MKKNISVFWFRRDLRLKDNHGLFKALTSGKEILPIFIFDKNILSQLTNKHDRRVDFIFQTLTALNQYLAEKNTGIHFFYDEPIQVFKTLSAQYQIENVFANEDYEPYAFARDQEVSDFLNTQNIGFKSYKDQVIFAKNEIVKNDGKPYTVYTPYFKKWMATFRSSTTNHFLSEVYLYHLLPEIPANFDLSHIGFFKTDFNFQSPKIDTRILSNYDKTRNLPFLNGTSDLSVHLRFGTISIRYLTEIALKTNQTYLKELIWREFFMQILYHFPHTVTQSFKPKYNNIKWGNDPEKFKQWCEGKTGFPIVDAGMRQLNQTGLMHNRVRMITASFLIKDLLVDWRLGEAYFAEKLLDFDLSANIGNWQWASGSGCDAAPYFRIFNPNAQQQKFDPDFQYIKKWIPEWGTSKYPDPIIDHKTARLNTLSEYKKALAEY